MENQENDYFNEVNNQFGSQTPVPNATLILILGIASIVTCCCYGIVGIICGIVAIVLAKTAKETYESNPGLYTESSYKNVNAGRTCAIIGLILSVINGITTIVTITMYGIAALADPSILRGSMGY